LNAQGAFGSGRESSSSVVGALILLARESPISHQVPAVASSARTTQRDYVTAKGERREIELPDGSTLSLNTDTAVEVEYSQARRLVHLRRGQAIFSVAHDAGRPFVVHAADRRVQATGTLFDVYLAQDRLQVVLAEGEVIVSGMDAASAGTSPVRLAPGQAFVSRAGMADEVRAADVHRAFRWRDGFVEFNDETLAAAVAEMNRYSDHPATVLDERAAALRISGVFRTDRPEEFLSVIRELLPVDVRVSPDGRAEIAGL
jgi:transmembrane sensor